MRGLQHPRNLLLLCLAALLASAALVFGGPALLEYRQQRQLAELTAHYAQQLRALDRARDGELACAEGDRACLMAAMNRHPARQLPTWQSALALPLRERIAPAPALLVNYLELDNRANGYPHRPRPARPDAAFTADLQAAFDGLPPEVLRLIERKLIGIYLVDDLGGTGFSETALDAQGRHAAAFVMLDAGVLAGRVANTWASWKEASPFAAQQGWSLEAVIAEGAGDNRMRAIQYILLHELGHVVAAGTPLHPWPGLQPRDIGDADQYPFFKLSWRVPADENRYESLFEAQFPLRREVVYYFGPQLKSTDMAAVYAQLEQTNFPTLYAATQPGDDFAESFANYVYVERLQQPFRIELRHEGRTVKHYQACWQQPRCAAKREQLEQLLGLR